MEYSQKRSFEKAFKIAVTNFDETKIWFEHKSKSYQGSNICFVLEGKLKKLFIYRTSHHIDIWKNYFIEFLNTGNFDYNGYWKLYDNHLINSNDIDKIFKFPLCENLGHQFYPNSKEMNLFLSAYRINYKGCGIKQVGKPLELNYEKI